MKDPQDELIIGDTTDDDSYQAGEDELTKKQLVNVTLTNTFSKQNIEAHSPLQFKILHFESYKVKPIPLIHYTSVGFE